MSFAKTVFLVIAVVQLSYAYPDGADSVACGNMLPVHDGIPPQTSPAPFTITPSATSVSPGTPLNVVIARTNTVTFLRGFMIEARNPAGQRIGQFNPTAGTRQMICPPGNDTNFSRKATVYRYTIYNDEVSLKT